MGKRVIAIKKNYEKSKLFDFRKLSNFYYKFRCRKLDWANMDKRFQLSSFKNSIFSTPASLSSNPKEQNQIYKHKSECSVIFSQCTVYFCAQIPHLLSVIPFLPPIRCFLTARENPETDVSELEPRSSSFSHPVIRRFCTCFHFFNVALFCSLGNWF